MALLAHERRPLGLGEIARKLEISKSSTHELLSTLTERGFVHRRDGGIYELGVKAWEVGSTASIAPLISAAAPVMERIAARLNEDVVLGVLSGFESINVHIVGSGQAVRVYAPVGTRFPAHHASTGLLLLAFQPEGYLETVLPPTLSAASPRTITDPDRLRTELTRTRSSRLCAQRWRLADRRCGHRDARAECGGNSRRRALRRCPSLSCVSCLDAQHHPDPGRGGAGHHAGHQWPAAVAR